MTEILVSADADSLAHAVAARLITKLVDVQTRGDVPHVVLTGGRVAAVVYRAVADSPARTAIDWSRVEFWWGDERFLPDGDPDRNETQARDAFLTRLEVDPARIHPMPADTGQTPEEAAAAYTTTLATAANAAPTSNEAPTGATTDPSTEASADAPPAPSPGTPGSVPGTPGSSPGTPGSFPRTPGSSPDTPGSSHGTPGFFPGTPGSSAGALAGRVPASGSTAGGVVGRVPGFDVVLLGVGPDGHVASLFPGHPARETTDVAAVAVHDSPKPPPTRVSLTFPALAQAEEVWFVVSGEDKADAVAQVLSGDSDLPAATPKGRSLTLWLLDQAAASKLP